MAKFSHILALNVSYSFNVQSLLVLCMSQNLKKSVHGWVGESIGL